MGILQRLNQWCMKQIVGEADCCLVCRYANIEDNPLSKQFPIVKCKLDGGRQVYLPKTRPGWCKR